MDVSIKIGEMIKNSYINQYFKCRKFLDKGRHVRVNKMKMLSRNVVLCVILYFNFGLLACGDWKWLEEEFVIQDSGGSFDKSCVYSSFIRFLKFGISIQYPVSTHLGSYKNDQEIVLFKNYNLLGVKKYIR